MREYQDKAEIVKVVSKVTCDKCLKEIEFFEPRQTSACTVSANFRISAGYGSRFDTMGSYRFELCDDCTEEFMKSLKVNWEEHMHGEYFSFG